MIHRTMSSPLCQISKDWAKTKYHYRYVLAGVPQVSRQNSSDLQLGVGLLSLAFGKKAFLKTSPSGSG